MCGISGFNWKDEGKIAEMVQALSHRGPDANGVFTGEGISLGHNRLSVIDLSPDANQPMFDESGELVIVYNGEVYNFQDIRKELEGEYNFKTKSDTEVILAGYKKWGNKVVEKLNGMFAFAIWNKNKQELFIARDHAGIKPLYYFWDGKELIFASEIKAILTHDIERKLNISAFNQYLRVLYVPEPNTLLENIYKLPPSSTLILKGNSLKIESYGKNMRKISQQSYSETKNVLREKVIQAVRRQLVSDVPVGVYLSGGIDSSTVLFSMSQFNNKIKTFSVGFDLSSEEEVEKFNSDFDLARKTAQFFGTDHHTLKISAQDALGVFERVVGQNDDLISNPTSIPMMLLAEYAKKEVTVALTGNGGDELFGGYDRYRMALFAYYYKKLPAVVRKVGNMHGKLLKLNYKSEVDLFAKFMFEKDAKLLRVISPSIFEKDSYIKEFFYDNYLSECEGDPAECFMSVDQRSWLPDQAFGLSDRMSMLSALEERVPLVDKDLVVFASTLPRAYKVDLFRTKKILKDAFREDLPEFLFSQPKRGWFSPGAKWLRHPEFQKFARDVLSEKYYSGTKRLFDWNSVENMWADHVEKREYNLTILWALLSFQIWAKHNKVQT